MANVRSLPVKKEKAHIDSLKRGKCWGVQVNFLIQSQELSQYELMALTAISTSEDLRYLPRRDMAKKLRMNYDNFYDAINSLLAKNILVREFYRGQELFHISHPMHWGIAVPEELKSGEGSFDPKKWEEKATKVKQRRTNDLQHAALKTAGYLKIPRTFWSLDLDHQAKRLWMYLASLGKYEHPTHCEISEAIGFCKATVGDRLKLLEEKNMIRIERNRITKDGVSRDAAIYHITDIGDWDFKETARYKKKTLKSPLGGAKEVIGRKTVEVAKRLEDAFRNRKNYVDYEKLNFKVNTLIEREGEKTVIEFAAWLKSFKGLKLSRFGHIFQRFLAHVKNDQPTAVADFSQGEGLASEIIGASGLDLCPI